MIEAKQITTNTDRASGKGLQPLLVGAKDLAPMLGISVPTLWRWDSGGLVGPAGVKICGRRLWSLAEIKEWIAVGMPDRESWRALQAEKSRV
jgi:predicted DNA-binding transcriptional regulator AlpA